MIDAATDFSILVEMPLGPVDSEMLRLEIKSSSLQRWSTGQFIYSKDG